MPNLNRIIPAPKTGDEKFIYTDQPLGITILDFWRWSVSDLISNATRGILAEFIVASALKIDLHTVRDEWASYDLLSPEGIKIEVKSSAYLQSWAQRDFSKVVFSIAPARLWNDASNEYADLPVRHSDVYVFCLLKHREAATLDPLILDQWEFYVLSTSIINGRFGNQKKVSLTSLQKLSMSEPYNKLRESIIACHKS